MTEQRTNYFTRKEVGVHCSPDDCWVSSHGQVFDLTALIAKYRDRWGHLLQPIINSAGTDISHWFDATTREPITRVDPATGFRVAHTPQGRFIHLPPTLPTDAHPVDFEIPWWLDPQYLIGKLTNKPRLIRIINCLNGHEVALEVSSEESIAQIRNRYMLVNAHANAYTWKRLGVPLQMDKTLDENGMEGDDVELGDSDASYVPAVHLHFDDDLTVA